MPSDRRALIVAMAAAGMPKRCARASPLTPASSFPGPASCAIQAFTPPRIAIAAVGAPANEAPTATSSSRASCSK